jgi:hypothetical protein
MNYAELVSVVKGYAENDFPSTVGNFTSTNQLNTFIKNAEERIYNSAQILTLRRNVTGNCTSTNKYLTMPSDWLATYSVAVIDGVTGEYDYLIDKDVNFIRAAYPSPTATGKPKYYALFDENTFILGPTPDQSYLVEMHYFYYPASIVEAGTSWLGDNFETILLYGTLLEAATFMKSDPDVMTNYEKRYLEALVMLKRLSEGKNRSDMYRNTEVRIPVR